MRWWWKVLLLSGASVLAAFAVCFWSGTQSEPMCQGRPLSKWIMMELDDRSAELLRCEIGTNALPFLLQWMKFEEKEWMLWLRTHPNLPGATLLIRRFVEEPKMRGNSAAKFCCVLGSEAAGAVTELSNMANDQKHSEVAGRAVIALT